MEKKSILSNKYYLYLTEFFAGIAVVAIWNSGATASRPISVLPRLCGPLLSEQLL